MSTVDEQEKKFQEALHRANASAALLERELESVDGGKDNSFFSFSPKWPELEAPARPHAGARQNRKSHTHGNTR